ncbi:MAG: MgtC/SapB family protein [Actinomycetota bacterium]
MFGEDILSWLLTLSLAAIAGALIGGERESKGHPAGVRTQALVALAAALLTRAGETGFIGPAVDLSRVASQVVTGIGFIGAGVILKNRGTVTGLTTAATLFLSAGVGVAIGTGLIIPALMATAIALVVIYSLRLLKPFIRKQISKTIYLEYEQGHGTFGPLIRAVQDSGCTIQDLQVEDEAAADGAALRTVTIQVFAKQDSNLEQEMEFLVSRPEVRELSVVEG